MRVHGADLVRKECSTNDATKERDVRVEGKVTGIRFQVLGGVNIAEGRELAGWFCPVVRRERYRQLLLPEQSLSPDIDPLCSTIHPYPVRS